jgi:hypothetical protein
MQPHLSLRLKPISNASETYLSISVTTELDPGSIIREDRGPLRCTMRLKESIEEKSALMRKYRRSGSSDLVDLPTASGYR